MIGHMTNTASPATTHAALTKWADLSTSWPAEDGARWNAFRSAVRSGASADDAADHAGLDRIPAAPKVEFEW